MLGFPNAFSTATPCALMETSLAPAIAPNNNSVENRDEAPVANDGPASASEKPTVLQAVIRLLPNLVTHQPVTGMAHTEPIAVPKRQRPSRALERPRLFCTAGMRDTQVETINPSRR